MSRLAAALAVLALAAPGTASAFSKQDRLIPMSDGVKIATTYYVPDGAPPAGGWPAVMLFHGLGGSRTAPGTPLGMSLNSLAETQLVPQGYAALTFDARGHGQSEGLVSIDGPREIQDVRELFGWLAAQPGVNGQRIGAFGYSYGGGAIWRATAEGVPFAAIEPAITWTDLYSALLPQDLARSGVLLGFWQSIQARAAPGLDSIVNDAIAGQNLAALHAFADQRSVRKLLGSIQVPTFLMQGRRDFAFDLDHALTAYSRLKAPKRLYLADFGHPPAANPPGEAAHVLPEARAWFDRYLKGLPNGIDRQPPIEVAPDPWTGRTFHYRALPDAEDAAARVPGTRGDRLHRQGGANTAAAPHAHRDLRRAGAARLAGEPERLAAGRGRPLGADAAAQGDRRQRRRRARPPRREAEAGEDPADLAADRDSQGLPAAADDRRHLDRPELRQPPLLHGDSSVAAARRRACEPVRAGAGEADIALNLLTRTVRRSG